MKALLRAAITACVAAIAVTGSASAAQIYLTGITEEGELSTIPHSPWSLLIEYTPAIAGISDIDAVIDSADFRINRGGTLYQWNSLESSSQNRIRVAFYKTSYTIGLRFNPAVLPSGTTTGLSQADVDLTIGGGNALAVREATEANINALTASSTVTSGDFLLDDAAPFVLASGTVKLYGPPLAVPEPTSVMLLSGLGLVAGRRVMARRRQKAAEKAEAAA
jgi:hypothetical protein